MEELSKEMTYEEAFSELKEIVNSLEDSETKIDELETKLRRAESLIEFCKTKIKDVEVNIEDLLSRLGEDKELGVGDCYKAKRASIASL